MQKRLLISLLMVCASIAAFGQTAWGPMSGRVFEESTDPLRPRPQGLVGAVVSVEGKADTLHTTTDYDGNFYFKRVPSGVVRVRVSYLGYEAQIIDSVRVAARYGVARPVRVVMRPEAQDIEGVVVEGRAQLLSQKGDTLVYNAAAVRAMDGDEVLRVLEQLPGMEVDGSGVVKVHGEQIARIYVNDKLIFGDDPAAALNTLLASDVVKLEVFDEDTDEDRRQNRRFAQQQKVMNIRTRKDFSSMWDGYFLGSWGMDLARDIDGDRRQRYGAGLSMNLFSEQLRLSVDGLSNNIGRRSNRLRDILSNRVSTGSYTEQHQASLFISKLWGKNRREGQALDLTYTYSDAYSHSESAELRNYFATTATPARLYADSTVSRSSGGTHTVKLYGLIHPAGRHQFSSRNEFSYSTPTNGSDQRITNRSETLDQRTEVFQRSEGESWDLKNNLNWVWDRPKIVRPYVSLNSTVGRSERVGWRVDTLTLDKRVLETDYVGPHEAYNAEFSLQKDIFETEGMRMELFAAYEFDYEHRRTRQTAINTYLPMHEIDPTNTYNYTYDYRTHQGNFAFRINSNLFRMHLTLNVRSATMNKDEFYPETNAYDERFVSVLPSLSFTLMRHGRRINIFRYSTSATLPSVEQLRDRLDNSNPLLLQSGNPALKQSILHSFAINYPGNVNVNTGRNLLFGLTANIRTRQITRRSYYYNQDTYLPQWDYTAPAGSTRYSYENVNGSFNVGANISFSQRIQPLRSSLDVRLSYNYDQQPTYIEEERNLSRQHRPTLSLSLGGTQSKHLRMWLRSSTSYSYVENTIGTSTRYLYQTASAAAEIRCLKYLISYLDYSLAYMHYLTDSGRDNTTQMLNVMVGCQLAKGRVLVGVAAYDLLNRGSSYTTTTYADYEQQRWQPSFGRYFTLNVGVKLNGQSDRKFGR